MAETSTVLLVAIGAVFVTVALVAGLITASVLSSTSTARKRLFAVTRGGESTMVLPEVVTLSTDVAPDIWHRIGSVLGRSPKESARLRLRLERAGFEHRSSVVVYTLFEFLGPVIAGAVPLLLMSGPRAWFAAAGVALAAFFAPGFILENRLAKNRREIDNGLPDALDLIVVCIEAGSGLDQALVKTSDELAIAYPALAEELRIVTAEIRAGKPRLEAFKNLAKRTRVDDVRALVAMLVQTDRFGTSIGQALRTHADVSRNKRRQRAEERAQKVGVKLVFPLVLCFFPALYVVVMGPAVIQFIRGFLAR